MRTNNKDITKQNMMCYMLELGLKRDMSNMLKTSETQDDILPNTTQIENDIIKLRRELNTLRKMLRENLSTSNSKNED